MNIKPIVIFVLVLIIAIAFSSFMFSSTFIDTTGPHFRQEQSCTAIRTFEFDNIKVVYITSSESATLIDPDDTDVSTTCVPSDVTVYRDNTPIYRYTNNGEQTNLLQPDEKVIIDNDNTLDNGNVYTIPNGKFEDFDAYLYNGFYHFDIDNDGWSSNGYTTGSELYWRVDVNKANVTANILSTPKQILETSKVTLEVQSQLPATITFSDICLQYNVKGILGDVSQEECTGISDSFAPSTTKQYIFDINNNSDVAKYDITILVKNVKLVVSKVTTSGVRSTDLSRYLSGNTIALGTLKTDSITVSLLDVYIGELDSASFTLNEKIEYINSLQLSSSEKEQLIAELNLSVDDKDQLIKELQTRAMTMKLIIYGLIAFVVLLSIFIIIRITKKSR